MSSEHVNYFVPAYNNFRIIIIRIRHIRYYIGDIGAKWLKFFIIKDYYELTKGVVLLKTNFINGIRMWINNNVILAVRLLKISIIKSLRLGGNPISHTPAHESSAAVASFRTWPSSQSIIARGPKGSP